MKKTVYLSLDSVDWESAKAALKATPDSGLSKHNFFRVFIEDELTTKEIMEKLSPLRIFPNTKLFIHEPTESTPYIVYTEDEKFALLNLLKTFDSSKKTDDSLELNGVSLNCEKCIMPDNIALKIEPKNTCQPVYTENDIKEVNDELEYATHKISCLEDELQEFKNDLKDSKKDNEILLDKIKKLVEEKEELEEDKENLHKTIESLEDELSDANSKITDLEYDIAKRDCMLDDYEDKIKELEDKLSKLTPDPDNRILIHDGVAYRY